MSYFSNRYKLELFQLVDESMQKNFIKLLADNVKNLMTDLKSHMKNFKPYFYEPERVALKILELLITIAKNLSISTSFCRTFSAECAGITLLFSIINSNVFIEEIPRLEKKESKYEFKLVVNIYGNTLSILYNILKQTNNEFQSALSEQNAFESLIKASVTYAKTSDFRLKIYMSLAHLFVDKDMSQLSNVKQVIKELVDYSSLCASKITQNKMERCPISFESGQKEGKEHYESLILSVNESYFYLIDFLNVLYNFAVSDEIKYEIYETYGMKTNLSVFILNGNSIEKDYSLKLLMQLCYDKRVADLLPKQSIEVIDFIVDLVKNRNQVENKSLIRNGNGLLFVLNKGKTKRDLEQLDDSSKVIQSATNEGHIMISYNSKSRPLCLSIKVRFKFLLIFLRLI